ncbi:MAG: serine--tRNA ligase [SAR202 cluster bacterium]|nr:serine--tRNA ligase [Gammaproteobacteria bacterium]MBI80363.1 serine--tRNA ligase [Gammaproteobacteria bacterium]MCH2310247.1 serine--tRNA ligase [SAR202 cluster bacterium]
MIDIEIIRNNPEILESAGKLRDQSFPTEQLVSLDKTKRSKIVSVDSLRAKRNTVSKQLSSVKEKPIELIEEMREVGNQIKILEEEIKNISENLSEILLNIPNIPHHSVPVGSDEGSNNVIRTIGDPPDFLFTPRPHWEIASDLGILDLESGVKLSQSRFYVLKGKGATLQRALINWMLNTHISQNHYEEIFLPYLVNRETVIGSSHLPHFEENMYHDLEDDLFLVPTAEAPITGLFRDSILSSDDLPKRFVAHTPCWRREKFSAGKDTRGIKRVHQFDKVEMYKFVKPEDSFSELELLVSDAEKIAINLNISHRVLELCTGDLGFAAAKSYDIELWSPGSKEWLEVSSCSNCTDFQSRRSAIRYRNDEGKISLVHTLNGSGLAIPRVLIAILENYQQSDGSVIIPEVLVPYTGFDVIKL